MRDELSYQAFEKDFKIIVEAKSDSLLTLNAFQEMIDLDEMIKTEVSET